MAGEASLSDQNLEFLLAETRWGTGGVAARITAAPDPLKARAMWAGLTLYRLGKPEFQRRFDQALADMQKRSPWNTQVQSVIQAKHEMMASPGNFPFSLSNQEWGQQCQTLFGGTIDTAIYTPPSVYRDVFALVAKAILGLGAGIFVGLMLPEEALAAPVVVAIGGKAMAKGALNSGMASFSEHLLPGGNPLDDADKLTVRRRYELENKRRKLR